MSRNYFLSTFLSRKKNCTTFIRIHKNVKWCPRRAMEFQRVLLAKSQVVASAGCFLIITVQSNCGQIFLERNNKYNSGIQSHCCNYALTITSALILATTCLSNGIGSNSCLTTCYNNDIGSHCCNIEFQQWLRLLQVAKFLKEALTMDEAMRCSSLTLERE